MKSIFFLSIVAATMMAGCCKDADRIAALQHQIDSLSGLPNWTVEPVDTTKLWPAYVMANHTQYSICLTASQVQAISQQSVGHSLMTFTITDIPGNMKCLITAVDTTGGQCAHKGRWYLDPNMPPSCCPPIRCLFQDSTTFQVCH